MEIPEKQVASYIYIIYIVIQFVLTAIYKIQDDWGAGCFGHNIFMRVGFNTWTMVGPIYSISNGSSACALEAPLARTAETSSACFRVTCRLISFCVFEVDGYSTKTIYQWIQPHMLIAAGNFMARG